MTKFETKAEVIADTSNISEADWLEFRRLGIGGSDCAAVLHLSPFCTCRDLYYDKTGQIPVVPDEDNWIQKEYGHCLEDLVAKIFTRKTGLKTFQIKKMFRHPEHEFMLADLDYFVEEPNGSISLLECKTTSRFNTDKWDDDAVPINYELQCRHYMSVMDIDRTYIACLTGNSENDFLYRIIERDKDFEADIIAQEQDFWYENVKKSVPPDYTEGPDLVLKSIQKHFGYNNDDKPYMLSKDLLSNVENFVELKKQKSEIDKQSRELESKIKAAGNPILEKMKNGLSAVIFDSGKEYIISNKPTYRTSIKKESLEKLKLHHPDIYNEYASSSESRNLSIKVKEN